MSKVVPMGPCLALLKAFDPKHQAPQVAIAQAATDLAGVMNARSLADLQDNTGYYAAVLDRVVDMGIVAFQATKLFTLIDGGNFTLPVYEFKKYGARGLAGLDVWLAGNS